MRHAPPTLLSLLAIILSSAHTANGKPYLKKLNLDSSNALEERTCANPCGAQSQYCCQASETCVTSGWPPIAQCVTASSGSGAAVQQQNNANGQYQLITTTWTETDLVLRTSTYSTLLAAATPSPTTQQATVATSLSCNTQLGESPCRSICCATGQFCQTLGQCAASGGGVSGDVSSFYYSSVTAAATGTAFVRPTSNTVQTVTSTGSATTTVPIQSASATQGGATAGMEATTSNNGLSGGAIAGIVIGVLLGILVLLFICAACCFKGLLDTILGFFGLGPRRRRREETYIEQRHSHHTGGSGGAGGRRWFGGAGPSRVDRTSKKESGGFGGLTAVAAGLGTLAVLLGLKRRRDRRDKESYTTGSSYTYSDYTSQMNRLTGERIVPEASSIPHINRSLPLVRVHNPPILRPFSSTAIHQSGDAHSHYDPPSGWLWGIPPGEKREKEGWENVWIYGFFGGLLMGVIAYAYKPDTS
ncbi:MAG: hypothetical protein Q9222_001071 [Ikaeria aurantiellina]